MPTSSLRSLTVPLCLAALLVGAAPAAAGKLAGVEMPDTVTVGGEELVLNGMALRSKLIFKVYVAGLYLPAESSSAEKVLADDTTRHLKMQFVRTVDREAICDAWMEGLEANTPDASSELEGQFETLCSWMEEVDSGESYEFTYVPDTGTTVRVKGEDKGTLEGKPFADALFASWIGPDPGPGEGFKNDLMGG